MTLLVSAIRETESAMGDCIKRVMPCETENRRRLRKSILAARDLAPGIILGSDTLSIKRAGGLGMSPDQYHNVIGKRLKAAVRADQPIAPEILE